MEFPSDAECVICLEKIEPYKESIFKFGCGHTFHLQCICISDFSDKCAICGEEFKPKNIIMVIFPNKQRDFYNKVKDIPKNEYEQMALVMNNTQKGKFLRFVKPICVGMWTRSGPTIFTRDFYLRDGSLFYLDSSLNYYPHKIDDCIDYYKTLNLKLDVFNMVEFKKTNKEREKLNMFEYQLNLIEKTPKVFTMSS